MRIEPLKDGPHIARVGALVGDRARAEILTALTAGQALTAGELAEAAGVTKQTISSHLGKLLGARLIAVVKQGRHRYFRLADPDVAQLIESLMGVAYRSGAVRVRRSPAEPALRKARTCYDHLAGELGVLVFDALHRRHLLCSVAGELRLTESGHRFWSNFGIDTAALGRGPRPLCRDCLDWSARRHHLAGALGAALLERCFERGWARRAKGSRVVHFTAAGEGSLREQFELSDAGS